MSNKHSPNDHRSIVKNTNNPAHQADAKNQSAQRQLNSAPPPTTPDAHGGKK